MKERPLKSSYVLEGMPIGILVVVGRQDVLASVASQRVEVERAVAERGDERGDRALEHGGGLWRWGPAAAKAKGPRPRGGGALDGFPPTAKFVTCGNGLVR